MGRDEVSAGDMLIAAQRIQVFIAGMTEDAFMMNDLVQSAVLHQVAILGEAAKRVSVEFRARHPQVAWAALAGLRNRIVHEYDDISLLQPRIDDWRAMVDSVMIDPAYDGTVFNVALSDVPEKKADFVTGRYELPAPKIQAPKPPSPQDPSIKTVVAVKITDMLGEEVLVTREV